MYFEPITHRPRHLRTAFLPSFSGIWWWSTRWTDSCVRPLVFFAPSASPASQQPIFLAAALPRPRDLFHAVKRGERCVLPGSYSTLVLYRLSCWVASHLGRFLASGAHLSTPARPRCCETGFPFSRAYTFNAWTTTSRLSLSCNGSSMY
ncbi:hypothetical protein SODALDRAFT_95382 [Sodiomyces alkalinus F11]|uniref:Uncharacterized protein n=1 Tax=Sodiomyces alkalinus (strain CBS 110278 / VKM F-3762 / F11) TaxID=1314773 RepID=A0A3N2Q0T9_SODAK|nr:hypothetical protein SODALDRAFT_95382 [Sodiomyces alkalinus F11]ROT40384.1 hypothetical protein SODALDRAFT_95382 [Sodiomyces alkalinus F11]